MSSDIRTFTLSDKERDTVNEIIDICNKNELSIREVIRILIFTMTETLIQADDNLKENKI